MERPQIIVREFRQSLNRKSEPYDEVLISPTTDPLSTATWHRVKELVPPESLLNDDEGSKIGYMKTRWAAIEPAYKAWKEGTEIPLDGTPLAVWSGLTPAHAEIFRQRGLKTVEAVAGMSDSIMSKIMLPNVRQLRQMAVDFLENKDASAALARIAEKDDQIKAMQEMMDEMAARLAAVEGMEAPAKRGPGRPRKEEAEAA